MSDNALAWLTEHIAAGVMLREAWRAARTETESLEFGAQADAWAAALERGIAARKLDDAPRVRILDWVTLPTSAGAIEALPVGHPRYFRPIADLATSATGPGLLGDNPFLCHCERIKRANTIAREWRDLLPKRPQLKGPDRTGDREQVASAYRARAKKACETGERSSEEKDRRAMIGACHFEVPVKWIRELRAELPEDHPFRKKGRPKQQ